MPRPKKDAKVLNIKLRRDIYEQLEKYANIKGQTKTIAVERILDKAFKEYFDAENE